MIFFRLITRFWFGCVALLLISLVALSPTSARITESQTASNQPTIATAPAFLNTTLFSQPTHRDTIAATLASAPLMFIENVGQFDADASYQIRDGNHTVFLAQNALWITGLESSYQGNRDASDGFKTEKALLTDHSATRVNIRLQFVGANPEPRIEPFNRLDTTISYFQGNDPEKWHPDVPVWGGVRYVDLYPGIDLELNGDGGRFQPRLVVRDSTALNQVQLSVEGAEQVNLLATDGVYHSIRFTTSGGDVILPLFRLVHPDGTAFEWLDTPTFSEGVFANPFTLSDEFDWTPQTLENGNGLLYSTFLDGSGENAGYGIAVDAVGNAYVTGLVGGGEYSDTFVVKLNAEGSDLLYVAILSGQNYDVGAGIAVDAVGNAYITGSVAGANFPTTPNAFDTSHNGGYDIFVSKLNADGSQLLYSTFVGGEGHDVGYGIAVDAAGTAYITGNSRSTDFPTTPDAFDTSLGGTADGFVTRVTADGSALHYSTFFGGSNFDGGDKIAVDGAGNAYVTGDTASTDFPVTLGAFDTNFNGGPYDAIVTKFNAEGSALHYSTFLGGDGVDSGNGIAVDMADNAYVVGRTDFPQFPTTAGVFDSSYNGGESDTFITKLNADGSALHYSTFLGGNDKDLGFNIAIDAAGNAAVTGYTSSADFPTTSGAFDISLSGSRDVFVAQLNPNGSTLHYSTFLGGGYPEENGRGIAVDTAGAVYITGYTSSFDFPTTPGAYHTTHNGEQAVFITKLNPTTRVLLYLPLTVSE